MHSERSVAGACVVLAFALGACSEESTPAAQAEFPIPLPTEFVSNILRTEARALKVEGLCLDALRSMQPGDGSGLLAILSKDFRARSEGMAQGARVPDASLQIRVQRRADLGVLDRDGFAEELAAITVDWSSIERTAFEFDRFYLEPKGERAVGRAELYLAGELRGGGRADLRLVADVAVQDTPTGWRISQLDLIEAVAIRGDVQPFDDISAATGFTFYESAENRKMLQAFIDEHRVLALGGLSAVDWNGDGFVDLLGSLSGGMATLFLNDGVGGFVPEELPVAEPVDCGVVLLCVDLDGDGQPELVNSRAGLYAGESGHISLYVQKDGAWEHRPRAFTFRNPVGKRGVSVQTVVPFDANGDGLLDLYFGVYGDDSSRGVDYNLVEAHDGGTNYLFINQGNLEFREEARERGISGVQYTYVALPHDFDGDGDVDLFEGNDFGPNVLWLNDGTGHFSADEDSVLARESAYTMGVTFADHDDDGHSSMYVVNMSSEAGKRIAHTAPGLSDRMRERVLGIASGNMLYTEDDDASWFEHAERAGCDEGEWGWGAMFFDIDNDGDDEIIAINGFTSHSDSTLGDWDTYFWRQVAADGGLLERGERTYDVNAEYPFQGSYAGYQRDRLFYKADADDERFYDAAWHFGLDNIEDGRCVLPIDVDGDGDFDLAMWTLQGLRLYRNNAPPKPFARLRLRATKTHPAALGARVTVRVGEREQYDTLQLVEGFQSQQVLELQFGWDVAERVDEITVEWPSGETQHFLDLPLGQLLLLEEGRSEAQAVAIPSWPAELASPLQLQQASDRGPQATNTGQPLVLRHAAQPGADWALRDALQVPHADVEFRSAAWDAPAGSVYIYDAQGALCRAFASPPAPAQVERVLIELREEGLFPDLAVLTGRRFLELERPQEALHYFEAALAGDPGLPAAAEGLARSHRMLGDMQASERAYELSVEIDPDYAIGHFNLAILRMRTGRAAQSLASFEEALRIRGEHFETLMAMGEAALVATEMERSLALFERAAAVASDDAAPLVLRGKLFGQMKRYEEARTAFGKALEREADNAEAKRGLDRVKSLLGD